LCQKKQRSLGVYDNYDKLKNYKEGGSFRGRGRGRGRGRKQKKN